MKKFLIALSFLLFLSVPALATDFCYQETANVGTDCGGLATGGYWVSNNTGYPDTHWINPELIYDGDWLTGGYFGGDLCGYVASEIFVNYTKPSGATSNSMIQYKSETVETNFSIPSACWNAFSDKVVFYIQEIGANMCADYENSLYCMNDANGGLSNMYGSIGGRTIYEEAMVWSIPNASEHLALWLKFDGNLLDSSDFGNDANYYEEYGQGTFIDGKFGQAMTFTFTNSSYGDVIYVLFDNSMNFGTDDFSASFWVKISADYEYTGESQGGYGTYNPETDLGWYMEAYVDEYIDWTVGIETNFSQDDGYVFGTSDLADDEWHFITYIRDGVNIYLYVDNELQNEKVASSVADVSSSSSFVIGNMEIPPSSNRWFDGSYDEFRMWSVALTEGEIENLYLYNSLEAPPTEPDQTLLMFKPIIILIIAIGIALTIFKSLISGEFNKDKIIGTAIIVFIGMALITAISGIV